jgi:hypothetical protein
VRGFIPCSLRFIKKILVQTNEFNEDYLMGFNFGEIAEIVWVAVSEEEFNAIFLA